IALLVRRLLRLLVAVVRVAAEETGSRADAGAEPRVARHRADRGAAGGPDHRAAEGALLGRRHPGAAGEGDRERTERAPRRPPPSIRSHGHGSVSVRNLTTTLTGWSPSYSGCAFAHATNFAMASFRVGGGDDGQNIVRGRRVERIGRLGRADVQDVLRGLHHEVLALHRARRGRDGDHGRDGAPDDSLSHRSPPHCAVERLDGASVCSRHGIGACGGSCPRGSRGISNGPYALDALVGTTGTPAPAAGAAVAAGGAPGGGGGGGGGVAGAAIHSSSERLHPPPSAR